MVISFQFSSLFTERSVDTRVAIVRVLAALPKTNPELSVAVAILLSQTLVKETNEMAISALIDAFMAHQGVALQHNTPMDEKSLKLVNLGLVDKRSRVRTSWALAVSEVIWNITDSSAVKPSILAFSQHIAKNLMQIFKDSTSNPLQAVQNGTISSAYAISATSLGRWLAWGDDQLGKSCLFCTF